MDAPPEKFPKNVKPWLRPWKHGESGNPKGRPKGARNKFGEHFLKQFYEHWLEHGGKVLDDLVENDPATYARIVIAILPKVIELGDESRAAIATLAAIKFDTIRAKALNACTADEQPARPH